MKSRVGRTFAILIVIILLIGVTVFGYFSGYNFVENQEIRLGNLLTMIAREDQSPINEDTEGAIEVHIPVSYTHLERGIEKYAMIRALSAIERADVCVVMIDGVEGVTAQDTKLSLIHI